MAQRFGPYHVGETIGRGTFGKVKLAVHEPTGTQVALKIIPRKVMDQDVRSNTKITREITVLKVLRHPNIVRLYDVVQTTHDIVLFMEYVSGGELFDYICRKGRLTEDVARSIFQQIVAGVAYCHRYQVAHRDLKPENIMMEQGSTRIKLGDFGLSSVFRDGCFFETSCGTPNYASPEVVSGKPYAGPETDVWSCGVVLYTMVVGCLPFDDCNVGNLFKKIQTANYTIPGTLSEEVTDLLKRMLVVNPLERATMEQVMRHPWVLPAFPSHLLALHYDTIIDHLTFGKTVLATERKLDKSIVAEVAASFHMSVPEVAAIIAVQEKQKSPLFSINSAICAKEAVRKRYPASEFFEKSANVVDAKLWPAPLIIPSAEHALRDKDHDLHVSYHILLHKKDLILLENLSNTEVGYEAANSFMLTLSTSHGYGSLNANSLHHVSLGMSNASWSLQQTTHKGGPQTIRVNKEGGIAFCGSLPAYVQPEQLLKGDVDVYMEGYNHIVETCILLTSSRSKHTILGKLLGVVERPMTAIKPDRPLSKTPIKNRTSGGTLLQPLLKPMAGKDNHNSGTTSADRVLLQPVSTTKKGKDKRNDNDDTRSSMCESDIAFSLPLAPGVLQCDTVARFGNDFVRNGVLFSHSDSSTTLKHVYNAMEEEGFLWKGIQPFAFAAVLHPSVKLQIRIYKVTAEEQVVDVKVSSQGGMHACDKAVKLLERLRRKAVAHTAKKIEGGHDRT
ncbi:SNF1-related protein kinase [Trypanosoma rangeli]|uniref:SNF1-related protein kinase n=1 Tax=Trypanosoma rangeli TaxID=5698 RepID=A0A3R7KDE9_TRYRA|nr:SNF1-related protein kinase [Trypanosoma rangeli]RNF05832.1 SNF1-related protein kinase [Trypanosoma rangeli]|eukprot:RNF05832.1 SNF1-related protein kinase [Trypanosoma rangeli]